MWNGTLRTGVTALGMPSSNATLAAAATITYSGTTTITLNGNFMNVTTRNASGNADVTTNNVPIPDNTVIYVRTHATTGCSRVELPTAPNYTTHDGCPNVFVQGTYSKDITIGSDKDIIVVGDIQRTRAGSTPVDVELGMIATSYVRIKHPVNSSGNNATGTMDDVDIEAAIMSVQHSFIVDN